MIICGYAGIGKSYYAHHFPNVIDLESTPFEKDWDRYIKCALHYHKQGFTVLLSCHEEVRKRLIPYMNDEDCFVLVPDINDKDYYLNLYKTIRQEEIRKSLSNCKQIIG